MSEKLLNILKEINDGTRWHIYGLNLTKEELLSKDSNGTYFIEYLLRNNIPLYSLENIIANDALIAYLFCKNNASLYSYKLDEKTLFSYVNGKRIIDYILNRNNLVSDNIIYAIKEHTEIIDLLSQYNMEYALNYINPELVKKLTTRNSNGTYLNEKYLNDDSILNIIIPMIDNKEPLNELCTKYNNYHLMEYANTAILMSRTKENSTVLDFLVNDKKIIPKALTSIPNDIKFIKFLMKNNYYDYLGKVSEAVLLMEVEPNKTLLEILIEKECTINFTYIRNIKTIDILYRYQRLDLIGYISNDILLRNVSEVIKSIDKEETFLEYLIDINFNLKKCLFLCSDEEIIKILLKKERPDLLAVISPKKLLKSINKNDSYTYFDYILDNVKYEIVRVNINDIALHLNDINTATRFYITLAEHDMIEYVDRLSEDKLLKRYDNKTLLESLLEASSSLALSKIITGDVKAAPRVAFIIKTKGFEQKNINVSKEKKNFASDYLENVSNHLGIGPLYSEGEELLRELNDVFDDNMSSSKLIAALVNGYRTALVAGYNYEAVVTEIRTLIEIKKQNRNKFFYMEDNDNSYFSANYKSVFCNSTSVSALLHETGHALHYYIAKDKIPEDYNKIIRKVKEDPNLIARAELCANNYRKLYKQIAAFIKKKCESYFDTYYSEEKKSEIRTMLEKSKEEKKREFEVLKIPEEQMDIILNKMYTEEEYINHQKRIYISQNVDAMMRSNYGELYAICDILDAIFDGKFHSGALYNAKNKKIKWAPGHGIYYYYETDNGFCEMIANFALISKSKDAEEYLSLLKSIVGSDVYNMISKFYYNEIIKLDTEKLEIGKSRKINRIWKINYLNYIH